MKYPKILSIGSTPILDIFNKPVVAEEKIDGSLFRFGKTETGEFYMGSKSVQIYADNIQKMFEKACRYALSLQDKIPDGYVFFCEYLQRPKHNVLKYDCVPENNLILFDFWNRERFSIEEREKWAKRLRIVNSRVMYEGKTDSIKKVINLLEEESILGREKVEGIVIKNYHDFYVLGGRAIPMFGKYVREEFKERHKTEWKVKTTKGKLEEYIESFKNENRWLKAVYHSRDAGELTYEPKDIGKLMKEIHLDIEQEESENIKEFLYKMYIKQIKRTVVKGFPEFYKEWLSKLSPGF